MQQPHALAGTAIPALLPGHYLLDATGTITSFTPVGGFGARMPKTRDLTGRDFLEALDRTPGFDGLRDLLRRQLDLGFAAAPVAFPAVRSENVLQMRLMAYPVQVGENILLAVIIEAPTASISGAFPILPDGIGLPRMPRPVRSTAELSNRQLAALLAIGSAIHRGESYEVIFEVLAFEARGLLPFDRASITLLRPESGEIELLALNEGDRTGLRVGTFTPAKNTVTAWVVEHCRPIVTQDLLKSSPYVTYPEAVRQGYRSSLCYPLEIDGKAIGTLNFTSRQPNQYTQEHLEIVSRLAEQAAIAIQKATLRRKLETQVRRARVLDDIVNQMRSSLDADTVLQTVVTQLAQALDAERCVLYFGEMERAATWPLDGRTDLLATWRVHYEYHAPDVPAMLGFTPGAEFLACLRDLHRRSAGGRHMIVTVDDSLKGESSDELRRIAESFGIRSLARRLCIRENDRRVAMIELHSCRPRRWTDDELGLFQAVGEQLEVALNQIDLYARLNEQVRKLEDRSRQLRHLIEVGNEVKHHVSLEAVLDKVCEAVRESGWRRVVVSLHDRTREVSEIAAHAGHFSAPQLDGLRFQRVTPLGEIPRDMFDPQRRISRSYVLPPEQASVFGCWHASEVTITPLAGEGTLLGTLSVDGPPEGKNLADEIEALELFADQVTIAIRNAQLVASLKERLDEVTRLRELDNKRAEHLRRVERLRALGELSSGVAHDFNNALTIILGRAELLRRATEAEETRKKIEVIQHVARDAARVVQRIQDFGRIRQTSRHFTVLDLGALTREIIEVTRPRWKDATEYEGRTIVVECFAESEVFINGDAAELREVLTNLIFNAVDALPDGGGITLVVRRLENVAELRVTDTGIGMTPEVQERIFDPFYSTKGERGSGLGLSIGFGIVTNHQGQIQVASEPGRGTTFTLTFPIAEAFQTKPAGPPPTGRRRRLLVVDDDARMANVIGDMIQRLGHDVECVSSGREAIAALDRRRFDAVFADWGLPEMNGVQLIEALRPANPDLPMVLTTGWATVAPSDRLERLAVRHTLTKPFDITHIAVILEKILGDQPTVKG